MKLWSFQPQNVAESLLDGVSYQCIPEMSEFITEYGFKEPYNWMNSQMSQKIGIAPPNVSYPIWAWFKGNNKHTKPDRRTTLYNNYSKNDVILELDVNVENVLLSDFESWHYVLNNYPMLSEADEDLNLSETMTKQEIEQTWQKIFNTGNSTEVQACMWEIKPEQLTKIHKLK